MPRMNGMEASRELRARMNLAPIILLTWYADAVHLKDVAETGVSAVIPETNPAALQRHLNSLIAAA
jgi:CheY-like chemotaxis protein